jgi:hypothetical protein
MRRVEVAKADNLDLCPDKSLVSRGQQLPRLYIATHESESTPQPTTRTLLPNTSMSKPTDPLPRTQRIR